MSIRSGTGLIRWRVLLLVLLTSAFALSQGQTPKAKFSVSKRNPIPFRKFDYNEIKDPATNSPIKATSKLRIKNTLGKKAGAVTVQSTGQTSAPAASEVTGEALLNETNKVEQRLNALGYSLRSGQVDLTVPTPFKKDVAEKQRQKVKADHRAYSPRMPFKSYDSETMRNKAKNRASLRSSTPGPSGVIQRQSVETSTAALSLSNVLPAAWAFLGAHPVVFDSSYESGTIGQGDLFSTRLRGNVHLEGNSNHMSTSAAFEAHAAILDHPINTVMKLTVLGEAKNVSNPADGLHGSIVLSSFGHDQTCLDVTSFGNEPKQIQCGIPVRSEILFLVGMGICDVNVTMGYQGESGVNGFMYCDAGYVQSYVMPYVKTNAFVSASLSSEFMGVGYGVGFESNMILVNDDMELGGAAGIGFDKPDPYFFAEYYGKNNLTALSGTLAVKAEFCYLIACAHSTWNIFQWDGLNLGGYIIDPKRAEYTFKGGLNITKDISSQPQSESFTIIEPIVNRSSVVYNGVEGKPRILFRAGDIVTVTAGGCVQRGGDGKSSNRYVNPAGKNSDKYWYGTINIPGVTGGLVPIRSTGGDYDQKHPDVYTVRFNTPVPENIPEQYRYLVLGYKDNKYSDNGYKSQDNGSGDQCKNCRNAWVRVTVTHLKSK